MIKQQTKEKIFIKALYALAEGDKNIPTIYKENNTLNNIISSFLNKKYKYGYRIMIFYDFRNLGL